MTDDAHPPSRVIASPIDDRVAARRGVTILLLLAGAGLMVNYVETMMVPALPALVRFFGGVPYPTVAWVVSAYLLVGVVTTPLFAKLGDIYGKKRVMVALLAVYALAVSVAGYTPALAATVGLARSQAIYLLIAVRGVQGMGLALFPLAFAMIGEELPPERVGPAQGLVAATFAVGATVGLFVGSWLIQSQGWAFAYHTAIPAAVALVALAAWQLPESRHRLAVGVDLSGAALLGGALATFLLALTEGPSWGWTNPTAVALGPLVGGVPELLALAAGLAALFYWRERTASFPMLPLERLRERNLALSYMAILLVGVALFLGFVGLTVYVETPVVGLGDSVFEFGLLSLPTTVSMLVAAPFVGRAIGRFGPKPVLLGGAVLSTAGFLTILGFHRTYLEVAVTAVPTFVGLVAMIIAITNIVVLSARRGETGIQTGLSEMFQDLGASIGPVLVAAVLASLTTAVPVGRAVPGGGVPASIGLPTAGSFDWIFAIGALLSVGVGLLGVFLRRRTGPETGPVVDPSPGTAGATPVRPAGNGAMPGPAE